MELLYQHETQQGLQSCVQQVPRMRAGLLAVWSQPTVKPDALTLCQRSLELQQQDLLIW